jgi:hypothetical protein
MDSKVCNHCGESKHVSEFYKRQAKCKLCCKVLNKKWRDDNKDHVKEKSAEYLLNNKVEIRNRRKQRYQDNKEDIKRKSKTYRENNPEKVKATAKRYSEKNRDKRLAYWKDYREKNREHRKEVRKIYENKRIQTDPLFKLRKSVRNAVYCAILRSGSRKDGSILKHLPYSIDDLRKHLENLFEPWMSWDNWGVYDPDTWDENDQSTWTWQIDHVILQSDLRYDSFEHPNFQKCWSLDNLRPYSSKVNVSETKTRLI